MEECKGEMDGPFTRKLPTLGAGKKEVVGVRKQAAFPVERYLPGLRARHRSQVATRRALRETAVQEAGRAARILHERYRVKWVAIFGSAVRPDRFGAESDVDLAVEGLPSEMYFKAYSEVSQALSFPLDLVEWESAKPTLRKRIQEEGVILVER